MSAATYESVYILSAFVPRPRYHDYGCTKDHRDVTVCGLTLYDGKQRYSAVLQRWQADSFAEPCRKCFRAAGDPE